MVVTSTMWITRELQDHRAKERESHDTPSSVHERVQGLRGARSAVEPQEQRRVRPRAPDDCVSADGVEDQRPSSRPLMRRTTRTAYGPRQRASREAERRVRCLPLEGVVRILCLKTIVGRGCAGLRIPQSPWSARRLDVVVSLWEDVSSARLIMSATRGARACRCHVLLPITSLESESTCNGPIT
jgi:hypothetical protein